MASPSLLKLTLSDALLSFLWVSSASTIGILISLASSWLSLSGSLIANLAVTVAIVTAIVAAFEVLAGALGGASFNPTGTVAFYAAGVGEDGVGSMAVRVPAQTIGSIGGALAILEVLPQQYKDMVEVPVLKVDIHSGAIAEGILTFIISFAVLWIVIRGPSSAVAKILLISICTIGVVIAGAGYTGPSLNPANAFGWAYVNNNHNTWEQLYVYWICPLIGSILAAWVFRFLYPRQVKKEKEA